MSYEIPEEYSSNYEQFRDILSSALIDRITAPSSAKPKSKRRSKKPTTTATPTSTSTSETAAPPDDHPEEERPSAADDLADFTSYIAAATFLSLPAELQSLTHRRWADSPSLQARYSPLPLGADRAAALLETLDPSVPDSLAAYGIIIITGGSSSGSGSGSGSGSAQEAAAGFLEPVVSAYMAQATAAPPAAAASRSRRASACELCGRDWIGLSYHHLIPRMVHDKAVRRGWHRREDLQNVAWLCGACHRFVHQFAGHEELARRYYTVERLLEAEEVRRFAAWAARLRWKGR